MIRFKIVAALLVAIVLVAFLPASTRASHRSRSARSAGSRRTSRSARSSRETRGRGRRGERLSHSDRGRGRRGERLSRSDRRRGRRGDYVSSRRGRRESRRGHRIYYEARESAAPSPRPPSSGIPTERVSEIQRALIKEGYLEGQATGQYDDATVAAMKQFQTDNGFPASGLPSAYTLKKLGVSKRTNNGYAVPINSATEDQKKPQQTAPQVKKTRTPGEANQQIEQ